MAAAAQSRAPAQAPRTRTRPAGPRAVERRDAAPQPRARFRTRLPLRLLVFGICLTLLAVGRVTLSFAVVQKNLQTDTIVKAERQVTAENARLSEQAVGLASSLRVRNQAVGRWGLVPAQGVQYVTAHLPSGGRAAARH